MKVDFDRIKKTTDIVSVVESYGIALKRMGDFLSFTVVMQCP